MSIARVLAIAGSDSGGGAGIQADIKTISALGGYAMTAVTALTAQNTEGVFGVHAVPRDFIHRQIELVLTDIGADAVKTGMLHSAEVIEAVVEETARHAPFAPLVVDPVMVAKGGHRLLEPSAIEAVRKILVPRADLLTPNLPEAEALLDRRIDGSKAMVEAARALLGLGAKAVLMKGGHRAGPEVTDYLVTPATVRCFSHPRKQTRATHGTGCTLASAIATGLAQGLTLDAAVERGIDFVIAAMAQAPGLGGGHGPLGHTITVRPFP
ncbi:MAG TPA: bifunctional hydroxymethylpyrimidine kinase/phosphomethylpyrimidine kinase [Alphaproteobacteria bacterium]|nr:bifunctional hydroxymethylpyrimidine kinase/phosphomethylpyrimidine kinase [Alphaproteobacteria bacterium]